MRSIPWSTHINFASVINMARIIERVLILVRDAALIHSIVLVQTSTMCSNGAMSLKNQRRNSKGKNSLIIPAGMPRNSILASPFGFKATAEMHPMHEMTVDQDLSCMIKRFRDELSNCPKRRSSRHQSSCVCSDRPPPSHQFSLRACVPASPILRLSAQNLENVSVPLRH